MRDIIKCEGAAFTVTLSSYTVGTKTDVMFYTCQSTIHDLSCNRVIAKYLYNENM